MRANPFRSTFLMIQVPSTSSVIHFRKIMVFKIEAENELNIFREILQHCQTTNILQNQIRSMQICNAQSS